MFRQHAFPSDGAELEKCLLPATAIPEAGAHAHHAHIARGDKLDQACDCPLWWRSLKVWTCQHVTLFCFQAGWLLTMPYVIVVWLAAEDLLSVFSHAPARVPGLPTSQDSCGACQHLRDRAQKRDELQEEPGFARVIIWQGRREFKHGNGVNTRVSFS